MKLLFWVLIFLTFSLPALGQTSADKALPAVPQTSAPQVPAEVATAPDATPEALAREYIELWNSGDTARISAFPPFLLHRHEGRFSIGPSKLAKEIEAWRTSMPDLKFKIEDIITQGEKVVVRLTFTGTYKERLFQETGDPISPPRPVRAGEILIFQVKDGKILEVWEEYDELALRSEMGGRWATKRELAAGDAAGSAPTPPSTPAPTPPPKP